MSKIKDNGKNSFVFYDSFLSAMKHLNDAEFRECVLRIRDYALEGIDEESQSPYVNIILAMAKPNLDSARRRCIWRVLRMVRRVFHLLFLILQ